MFSKGKIVVFLLLLLFMLTVSFIVDVQASPTTWVIETVDAALDVGWYTSMALDSGGFPYISYYDNHWKDLKYARWTGVNWIIGPVDTVGDVGSYPSLALDSYDNPCISYYDSTNGDLKYARWTGSSWAIETVDSTGNVGSSNSLALDSEDKPHISYRDGANGNLKYVATSNEYFSTVDVILHNSDSDGYNDAVEVIINADKSYSGTMIVSVYAYLLGPQGYPPYVLTQPAGA